MAAISACIDSSALIDLINPNAPRHKKIYDAFLRFRSTGMVFVTDVVFAEVSIGMKNASELRFVLSSFGIEKLSASDEALYLAGQKFNQYKKAKGQGKKERVLPDFMIGAVAEDAQVALLTFNPKDFARRFDHLEIICPT
jgi:predicted nucleic acid-binding protein